MLRGVVRAASAERPVKLTQRMLLALSLCMTREEVERETLHVALTATALHRVMPAAGDGALAGILARAASFVPGHFLLPEMSIAWMGEMCPALARLDLSTFPATDRHVEALAAAAGPRLREVAVGKGKLLGAASLAALARCPSLEALELVGLSAVTMDDLLPLGALGGLTRLSVLADAALSPFEPIDNAAEPTWSSPGPLLDDRIAELGAAWPRMEALSLNDLNRVSPEALAGLVSALPRLVELSLSDCDCLTDSVCLALSGTCRALERLCVISLSGPLPVTVAGLRHVGAITTLRHLSLRDMNELEAGDVARALVGLTELRSISVSPLKPDPAVTRVSADRFFSVHEDDHLSLQSIDLDRPQGSAGARFPRLLSQSGAGAPALVRVNGRGGRSLDVDVAAVLASVPLPGGGAPSPSALGPLGALEKLEALLIRLTGTHPAPIESVLREHRQLPPLGRMRRLRFLHLSHWGLLLPGDLARVAALPALRRVTLDSCAFDNAALEALAAGEGIEEIDLSVPASQPEASASDPYSQPLVSGLLALSGLPRLRRLRVNSSERLTDEGLEAVSRSASIRDLAVIECQQISDAGVSGALARLTQLEALTLSSCRVTHRALSTLGRLTRLSRLDISQCPRLGDEAVRALAQGSLPHTLRALDVSWLMCLTDAGMGHLRQLRGLRTLRAKKLREVTPGGLMRIAGMGLESLDLSSNADAVTDEVLLHLAPTMLRCVHLDISHCAKVTSRGIHALRMMRGLRHLSGTATLPPEVALRGLWPPGSQPGSSDRGPDDRPPPKRYRASFAEEAPPPAVGTSAS